MRTAAEKVGRAPGCRGLFCFSSIRVYDLGFCREALQRSGTRLGYLGADALASMREANR